jgi:precorrin-2 dehydrogenase/sirohydrochlorin ferrochelatase
VIVGGSALAEEKAKGLIAVGARVRVIALEVTAGLREMAAAGALVQVERRFVRGDLAGAAIVIMTENDENDPGVRDAVFAEATAGNVLINTVDDLPRCNWIAPSIVRRGHLTIAISTAGKAPVLAVRLRQWLEKKIGAEHERFLEMAGEVRAPLAARHPDFEERRARWYRLIDTDVLALLRGGNEAAAQERFLEILGVAPSSLDPAARASWIEGPLPAEHW